MTSRPGRRSPLPTLILVLTTVSLAACAESEMPVEDAQTTAPAPITQSEVDAVRNGFMENMAAGDMAAVANLYSQDAVFHHPDGTKSRGRAEIQAALEESGGTMSDMSITPTRTERGTRFAYEFGTATGTMMAEDGTATPIMISYLVVIERQPDGSVRIVQDGEWMDPSMEGGPGMQ